MVLGTLSGRWNPPHRCKSLDRFWKLNQHCNLSLEKKCLFLKKQDRKRRSKNTREESEKSQKKLTLVLNFLEAGQPALHSFISYLLRRILLCQCVHASLRDDSVVWSGPELLRSPCQDSRSQQDLACTPEMHDGWDRDIWCKLSHRSAGVYHIMRHQSRRNKHSPYFMEGTLCLMRRLTLSFEPLWQHSGASSPLNNDEPTLEGKPLTWSPACACVLKKQCTQRSSV